MIPLKITFQSLTVRSRLDKDSFSFEKLNEWIRSQFPTLNDFYLKYWDEEDALIDLRTEADLEEALYLFETFNFPALRLLVVDKNQQVETPIQNQPSKLNIHPLALTLLKEISSQHEKVSEKVIDWWLKKMPEAYFREIDKETRLSHLRALIALQMAGQKQEISLTSNEKNLFTFIKPQNYVGLLAEVMASLPKGRRLKEANIYTSLEGDLVIDVFEFDDLVANSTVKFRANLHPEKIEELTGNLNLFNEHRPSFDIEHFQEPNGFPIPKSDSVKRLNIIESSPREKPAFQRQDFLDFLSSCDEHYVLRTSAQVIKQHFYLLKQCIEKESLVSLLEKDQHSVEEELGIFAMESPVQTSHFSRLIIILKNEQEENIFQRIIQHLGRFKVDIQKATLNRVEHYPQRNYHFLILTCFVRLSDGQALDPESELAKRLCEDISRLPYLDDSVFQWVDYFSQKRKITSISGETKWVALNLTLTEAEIILAIARLVHCLLAEESPLVYTLYHVESFLKDHPLLIQSLLRLWEIKFAPLSKSSLSSRYPVIEDVSNQIKAQIETQVELEDYKIFFHTFLSVISFTVKTNIHSVNRMSLTLRLDPAILREKENNRPKSQDFSNSQTNLYASATQKARSQNLPFALIYSFGRNFTAFHTRIRPIARGGIKLLMPESLEQFTVTLRTILTESISQARIMDYKNKDIPEGGAKAMILCFSENKKTKKEEGWQSVKSFVDGILEVTCPPARNNPIVDYYGEEELVFLGPDEYINNDLIQWTFDRAIFRLHPFPNAFMSSKTEIGIHHRQYAVSAEGIYVFLKVALKRLEDHKLPEITVKIAGGPENDITAGLIKILVQSLGSRVKFVAVMDASGLAEDPQGLEHKELMRLVDQSLPIMEFQKDLISQKGHLIAVNEPSGAGMKAKFSMPFKLPSTVLICAEGRPNAINESNWKMFFQPDQQPMSKIIIEAEHGFISSKARLLLSQQGISIIGNLSATKCSVISSSYEIMAGILLKNEEFLTIRDSYIKQVLDRLRHLSKLEAELLFKEFQNQSTLESQQTRPFRPLTLPEISLLISKAILKIKDAIYQSGQLDVYVQPLPNLSQPTPVAKEQSFYIESPESSPAYQNQFSYGKEFEALQKQATSLGFTYQLAFHQLCRELLFEYLPPALREMAKMPTPPPQSLKSLPEDWVTKTNTFRLDQQLPILYKTKILATALACKIVYKEGLGFLDKTLGVDLYATEPSIGHQMINKKIAEWSFRYLYEFERTSDLINRMKQVSTLEPLVKDRIIQILEWGGTRIGIELMHSE